MQHMHPRTWSSQKDWNHHSISFNLRLRFKDDNEVENRSLNLTKTKIYFKSLQDTQEHRFVWLCQKSRTGGNLEQLWPRTMPGEKKGVERQNQKTSGSGRRPGKRKRKNLTSSRLVLHMMCGGAGSSISPRRHCYY